MDGPPTSHKNSGMSELADRVNVHRIPERPTNRTKKALKFSEIALDVSLGELLTFNSRHGVDCADLPHLRGLAANFLSS